MFLYNTALDKAKSLKEGDMVSWNSSGGRATGKVIHVMDYGTLDIPNVKFKIKGEKDNPAVLIQLYRDGKETDIQVGHKMSSLTKSLDEQLLKHASHNQSSHGKGGGAQNSESKSFTAAKISAKDIKVGDRLDKAGKTRVHAVKMIGDKIAVGLKTRGSGTGGFAEWNPEEDITVFRKVIEANLFKHGSHNQKTHAGSRGGSSGSDGSATSSGEKTETIKDKTQEINSKLGEERDEFEDRIEADLESEDISQEDYDAGQEALGNADDAIQYLEAADNEGVTLSDRQLSLERASSALDDGAIALRNTSLGVFANTLRDLAGDCDELSDELLSGKDYNSVGKAAEFDLLKHGSHNQSSHGRKGGGGGGSSAPSSLSSKKPNSKDEIKNSLSSLNRAKKFAGKDPDAQQKVKDVESLLRTAQKVGGKEAIDNLSSNSKTALNQVKEGIQFGGVNGVDLEEAIHESIVSMGRALGGTGARFKSITSEDKTKYLNSNSGGVQTFGAGGLSYD